MTEDQVFKRLSAEVAKAGSHIAWITQKTRDNKLTAPPSQSALSSALAKRTRVPASVLAALGLERVTTIRKIGV